MTTGLLEREEKAEEKLEADVVSVRRTITVLDAPEHSVTYRTQTEEVATARALFASLVGRGYFAYVDLPDRYDGSPTSEQIDRFTEDADISLMPVMVGG